MKFKENRYTLTSLTGKRRKSPSKCAYGLFSLYEKRKKKNRFLFHNNKIYYVIFLRLKNIIIRVVMTVNLFSHKIIFKMATT